MPNVDGIEATERIAQSVWAMPVVVLSAYDEPQMIEARWPRAPPAASRRASGWTS
jgi:CheY-like chemotaxis protein